jgi:hypothetical protein
MHGQTSWQGTATELLQHLNGAIASAKALGRWLNKPENLQRLNAVSFEITLGRDSSTERNRLIRIDRIGRTQ